MLILILRLCHLMLIKINKIVFYKNNEKLNILCAGGYSNDKNIISDLINISFNIDKNSKELFFIKNKSIIRNAHNSWITGLLIKNYSEFKDRNKNIFDNYFSQSNLINENSIFFTTSHDKKIKILRYGKVYRFNKRSIG